jgi:hypothetical protein
MDRIASEAAFALSEDSELNISKLPIEGELAKVEIPAPAAPTDLSTSRLEDIFSLPFSLICRLEEQMNIIIALYDGCILPRFLRSGCIWSRMRRNRPVAGRFRCLAIV